MLSELEFFTTLIRAGSLSAAAGELNITPPAVSKRLVQLEERLGVRLLNRTTRHFSITPEGEVFLNRSKQIIQEIQEMEQEVQSLRSCPKGLLRINATPGFGRHFVSKLISEFTHEYPDITVSLMVEINQPDPTDGEFDIGIRFGLPPDSNYVAQKIMSNKRFLCASPAYLSQHEPITYPTDLQKHNCIILKQDEISNNIWRFQHANQNEHVRVKGNLVSNDGEIVVNWALDGLGVLVRAEWDVQKYLDAGQLVRLLPEYELPDADIYVVYPERKFVSAKAKAFISFLMDYVSKKKTN